MPPDDLVPLFDEYMVLTALATGLRGLRYWYHQANASAHAPPPSDAQGWSERAQRDWWHYTALMLHADVLFTGKRSKDTLPGAVFRALRDMKRPEVAARLHQALDQKATANGKTLRDVIGRVRNSLSHFSFRMDDLGDDFLHWGEGSNAPMGVALLGLIEAIDEVAATLDERKFAIYSDVSLSGHRLDLEHYIATAPDRARALARARRREQSVASKRGPIT